MQAVRALQDDSGHWYLIPNGWENTFNSMLENCYDGDFDDYDDSFEEFDKLFGQYRTGGDLNLVQLYIDEQ